MHGTIVVKDSVLAENPWVAKSIYDAFDQAKQRVAGRAWTAGEANTAGDKKYQAAAQASSAPIRCPMASKRTARPSRRWKQTAFKQGLTPRRMSHGLNCSSTPASESKEANRS